MLGLLTVEQDNDPIGFHNFKSTDEWLSKKETQGYEMA